MKLSDYVIEFLTKQGIKHVFVITGGAAAHLIDSAAKNRKIDYICTQHEQAAAMAADAYSRVSGNLGAAIATSGPGATNLITGICCAYYDSIPVMYITGQVATFRLKKYLKVRQLGFQETDVVAMCKSITKYAVLVDDPKKIRYELEKAAYLAKSGRPGPVLIDIPDNIQRENIEPAQLKSYRPDRKENKDKNAQLTKQVAMVMKLISQAERPVVVLGAGIKFAGAQNLAKELTGILKIPIVLTWATMDMFPYDQPLLVGGFGLNGPRYGNFTVQNSDLILSIGSRLDTHATGSPISTFARKAKKIIVDIDPAELIKFSKHGMKVDIEINADAKDFLAAMLRKQKSIKTKDLSEWLKKIKEWRHAYKACPPDYYKQKEMVNPYVFLDILSKESSNGDIIIADTGNNVAQVFQGYKVKNNQMIFSAFNNTPMGYSLPASIGAYFANKKKNNIICITGDGGIQMNIQELATIAKHNIPIKIFVFNNQGYGMIKQTQQDWLEARYEASCVTKGVAIPNFIDIAKAYGLRTVLINNHMQMRKKVKEALNFKTAVLCDLRLKPDQKNIPMLKFGRPIEDQSPLLCREEFMKNMIIKPLDASLE
ncbi:MAG: thiamine pyrophosphate-binding protein [Elusimicrobia bacterium]|nr:thiamine pyrophosphate-binding protein [Candidatus Liberimonas magnetica]